MPATVKKIMVAFKAEFSKFEELKAEYSVKLAKAPQEIKFFDQFGANLFPTFCAIQNALNALGSPKGETNGVDHEIAAAIYTILARREEVRALNDQINADKKLQHPEEAFMVLMPTGNPHEFRDHLPGTDYYGEPKKVRTKFSDPEPWEL